jgi:hypothetical protein
MTSVPTLLDDAGAASIATAVMMSHHGFCRDIRRFGAALEALAGDVPATGKRCAMSGRAFGSRSTDTTTPRTRASFRTWHVDTRRYAGHSSGLRRTHHIDSLLKRGDGAFADLSRTVATATRVISELDPHLATEEAEAIPHLRG